MQKINLPQNGDKQQTNVKRLSGNISSVAEDTIKFKRTFIYGLVNYKYIETP